MKNKILLFLLFSVCIIISAFAVIKLRHRSPAEESFFTSLLDQNNESENNADWKNIENSAQQLRRKIEKDPADSKSILALAALYIREARNTGNFNYYNKAALKCINAVLAADDKNFEALIFKSTILLSQHRFKQGLDLANRAQLLFPKNAYVYGLIIDGNVELGNYKEALAAAENMISIRPDIRSYSRIAYLREIHGDLPGAIEAMKLAVDAGVGGDENTEWCRVQLGKLFEKLGQRQEARMHYTMAQKNRINYPYALAGLARLQMEEKDLKGALKWYVTAYSIIPDHLFKEGMIEVYRLRGDEKNAVKLANELLKELSEQSSANNSGNEEGQNEDHEMAHAWMGVGNYKKALEFALLEYSRRPANIEVNETVALVYFEMNRPDLALPYISNALKTKCKNPELLCHAGLIYAAAGKNDEAKMFLQEALGNNPVLSEGLKEECKSILQKW